MIPQTNAAIPETEARVTQAPRAVQKRWPMALSIWAAIAAALAMWAGIVWIISLFLGIFA
jgi:hypothetical protein